MGGARSEEREGRVLPGSWCPAVQPRSCTGLGTATRDTGTIVNRTCAVLRNFVNYRSQPRFIIIVVVVKSTVYLYQVQKNTLQAPWGMAQKPS